MKKAVYEHIRINRKKYMYLILSLVLGMILGYFALMAVSEEMMTELKKYMTENLKIFLSYSGDLDSKEYFKSVFSSEWVYFLILWGVAHSRASVFFPSVFMLYKGYTFGFTFAFITNCFDGKGLLFNIAVLLTQNTIKIPTLLFASNCSMSYALKKSPDKVMRRTGENKGVAGIYTAYMLASLLVYSLGIFVECYIIPYFVFILAEDMI